MDVSVPWVGDYQFLPHIARALVGTTRFPSPESGIINSFTNVNWEETIMKRFRPLSRGLSIPSKWEVTMKVTLLCFRPLSRGLSIPSTAAAEEAKNQSVSVPWVGDYQFLLCFLGSPVNLPMFPSPESGIINSFTNVNWEETIMKRFRPLSRGLSIPSYALNVSLDPLFVSVPWVGDYQFLQNKKQNKCIILMVSVPWVGDYQFLHVVLLLLPFVKLVSVPWVGDYQFLRTALCSQKNIIEFPSPESGIINSFLMLFPSL